MTYDPELELAELGGWPEGFGLIPAQYPSIIAYIIGLIMGMVTVDYAFQAWYLRNDGICLAFLLFTVLCFGFAIHNWNKVYEDCKQKGIKIKAEESRRAGEAARQRDSNHRESQLSIASELQKKGGLTNLEAAYNIYSTYGYNVRDISIEMAQEKEKLLDYKGAIAGFEELGLHKDAKRVRRKMLDEKKVDQTVVHGDYVDDRDTIIKDSVVNRSNIGGDSKAEGLREAKSLFEEGLIDESEYKQMKKEILGK